MKELLFLVLLISFLQPARVSGAMWERHFVASPTRVESSGFDLERHRDGFLYLARFENVDASSPTIYLGNL
jgi:hypothetical protein